MKVELLNPLRTTTLGLKSIRRVVNLREPLVRDMAGLSPAPTIDDQNRLLERISDLSIKEIEALTFTDYAALTLAFTKLLSPG